MNRLTLQAVLNSRIPFVLNLCNAESDTTQRQQLLSYVNEAQERLLSYPDAWWGTWQRALFNMADCSVVWPRGVVAIRGAKVCGTPVALRNEWYDFTGAVGEPCANDITGNFIILDDEGTTPVDTNIETTGNTVRFYAASATDYGKRVLVQGYDHNGQWVSTEDTTQTPSVWVDGEYVTLGSPFVDTATQWQKGMITGIQKDVTNKNVQMFQVTSGGVESTFPMADYQPQELVPQYRRSKMKNWCGIAQAYMQQHGVCSLQIETLVKLGHIPVYSPTDYFVIGNLPALKDAATAVKMEEDGNDVGAQVKWESSLTLLRKELSNFNGRNQNITAQLHGGLTFYSGVMRRMR